MKKILNKKGSALVYALIMLTVMMIIAIGSYRSSTIIQRTAIDTNSSVSAMQAADSGVEIVLKRLKGQQLTKQLKDIIGLDCHDDPSLGYAYVPIDVEGRKVEVWIFDKDKIRIGCSSTLSTLVYVQSAGSYNETARAVEVKAISSGCSEIICGSTQTCVHDGITYGTVMAEDKRCWLDRNLGAERVARSSNDSLSYGWLFQWGRKADGHQIFKWEENNDTPLSYSESVDGESSSDIVTPPNDDKFLIPFTTDDWLNPSDGTGNLWGSSGKNDPCPDGFHVPTIDEWINFFDKESLSSKSDYPGFNSTLKIPIVGYRNQADGSIDIGVYGYYWSSSPDYDSGEASAHYVEFYDYIVYNTDWQERADGLSVRCIKD